MAIAIVLSYGIGRALRLPRRMAILVACGNSICGNSAIAAVAPVIGADGEDIASSIAFTAVLGVVVVLALPLAVPLIHLSLLQYGVLAGLTVYAVPQVLAATAPVGVMAVHIGTLVKLVRVLMLGPVVLLLSLFASRLREETDEPAPHITAGDRPKPGRIAIHHLVPWFILGFLVLAGIRSAGLIPEAALAPIAVVANVLTVLSMAALGLGVDVRVVARAGARVTGAVTLSLLGLGGISYGLIRLLNLAEAFTAAAVLFTVTVWRIAVTLDQLRVFVAVAERQHVTQAARALNLAQSAASAAIAALEGQHGVRLFHRVGRGIELTETGRMPAR